MWIVTSAALHALCSDTYWRHPPIDTLLQFKTNTNIFKNVKFHMYVCCFKSCLILNGKNSCKKRLKVLSVKYDEPKAHR